MLLKLVNRIVVNDDFTEVTYNISINCINRDLISEDNIVNTDDIQGTVFS
ncbi:MAG: hypothetical protein LBE09_04385 [Christensenellaceae bacterium]|jgi:hypothetical protein|nr:hypothetical protein [Christensenellaceae bacterium]